MGALDVVLGAKEAEDCVVEVTATGYDGLQGRLDQLPRSGDQLSFPLRSERGRAHSAFSSRSVMMLVFSSDSGRPRSLRSMI